jgi:hypothetical protein
MWFVFAQENQLRQLFHQLPALLTLPSADSKIFTNLSAYK